MVQQATSLGSIVVITEKPNTSQDSFNPMLERSGEQNTGDFLNFMRERTGRWTTGDFFNLKTERLG
jgi:hypothetical protein